MKFYDEKVSDTKIREDFDVQLKSLFNNFNRETFSVDKNMKSREEVSFF